MAKSNASGGAHRSAGYILIAIVNTARASAIRNLALDFCPNVVLLRDGQAAIEHLDRAGPPRLLLTELSLPRVDGFGVLRHLRRTTAGARATAIVVSSHDSLRSAAMKLADSLGISQILPLDIERSALRHAVADAMNMEDAGRRSTAPQHQSRGADGSGVARGNRQPRAPGLDPAVSRAGRGGVLAESATSGDS